MPGFPLARGSAWAGGRDHTLNRVSPRWGTTSCREAAPLTPHAQPGTPHQLSRGRSTHTTRPAEYPTPAVERPLHSHHTPSRVPQRWGATSCREAAPLTPHAQPGTTRCREAAPLSFSVACRWPAGLSPLVPISPVITWDEASAAGRCTVADAVAAHHALVRFQQLQVNSRTHVPLGA
jgi:hypothetical protein